jgi:hypothetical protein
MHIDWKVRCFSRTTKCFFDRYLLLDTATLDPVARSRVELCMAQRHCSDRAILKYRHLFREEGPLSAGKGFPGDSFHVFAVEDYFEDDDGKEISLTEAIRIREGNDNIVVIPPHYRSHDIALHLSDNSPVPENPQEHVNLSQAEVDSLAYFVKDVVELKGNAFHRTRPTFTAQGDTCSISTVGVEHIVTYLIVFRRLFMQGESGNYNKACATYARRFLNKRLTNWITAERRLYNKYLVAKARPGIIVGNPLSFTNRTLIDVLLTVRVAHQPKDDLRDKYELFLREAGNETRLECMFYGVVFEASRYYLRAYSIISNELRWYLNATGKSATFDFAPFLNEMGRGEQLTAEQAREQAIRNQAAKLGRELWEEAGKPDGQLERFIKEGEDRLREYP